jgi:hypothetical protein
MYSIKRAISIYTLYFTFVLSLTSTTFSHCVCTSILLLTLVTGRRERIWAFKPIMIRIIQHSFQSIFLRLGSNSLCSLPPMNHCDNTAEHQSFILCNHSTYSKVLLIYVGSCKWIQVAISYAADTTILFWVLNHSVGFMRAIILPLLFVLSISLYPTYSTLIRHSVLQLQLSFVISSLV